MAFQNFSSDEAQLTRVKAMLASGEDLVALVETDNRFITVTSNRLILHERSGGYSVIRNSQIAAIEVSDGRDGEKFVKVYFGGNLSRTLGAPSEEQAAAIVSAAARG
jgi:hypothetical protein